MGLIPEEVAELKKQCMTESSCLLLLYWKDVEEKLKSKEAGLMLARRMAEGCIAWAKNKPEFFVHSLDLKGDDALAAYALKREWYGALVYPVPLKWKLISHSPKEVRWLEASWCPFYAAGSLLGLDMNVICSESKGGFLDTALTMFFRETVNQKIKFENLRVRDNADGACESIIRLMD